MSALQKTRLYLNKLEQRAIGLIKPKPKIACQRDDCESKRRINPTLPQLFIRSALVLPTLKVYENLGSLVFSLAQHGVQRFSDWFEVKIAQEKVSASIRFEGMILYTKAKSRLLYGKKFDATVVRQSYDYARQHLSDKMRRTGESFFEHDLRTAEILIYKMRLLDPAAIAAVFLRHLYRLEVPGFSQDRISSEFSEEIAQISVKYFDLKLSAQEKRLSTDEVLRISLGRWLKNMMQVDIRIGLIKIASRLENLTTSDKLPKQEKRKLAWGTLTIVAPIAKRLGLEAIQAELYDRAFLLYRPQLAAVISQRINSSFDAKDFAFYSLHSNMLLTQLFKQHGLTATAVFKKPGVYETFRLFQTALGRKKISASDIQAMPNELQKENQLVMMVHSILPEDLAKARNVVESVYRRLSPEVDIVVSQPLGGMRGIDLISHRGGGAESFRTLIISEKEQVLRSIGIVPEVIKSGPEAFRVGEKSALLWKGIVDLADHLVEKGYGNKKVITRGLSEVNLPSKLLYIANIGMHIRVPQKFTLVEIIQILSASNDPCGNGVKEPFIASLAETNKPLRAFFSRNGFDWQLLDNLTLKSEFEITAELGKILVK